jgi:hypothetical protein
MGTSIMSINHAFAPRKNKPNSKSPHRRSEFIPTRRERAGNRTQFRTHRLRTAQASINMQNKPNLLDTQMNVNAALTMSYQNIRLPGPRKNKPNFEPTASADHLMALAASRDNGIITSFQRYSRPGKCLSYVERMSRNHV